MKTITKIGATTIRKPANIVADVNNESGSPIQASFQQLLDDIRAIYLKQYQQALAAQSTGLDCGNGGK